MQLVTRPAAGVALDGPARQGSPMLIFVHVPKASGTTLKRSLEREYRGRTVRDTEPGAEAEAELAKLSEAERKSVAVLKGHMYFGLHALFPQPAVYTTVLREPISRIVSH